MSELARRPRRTLLSLGVAMLVSATAVGCGESNSGQGALEATESQTCVDVSRPRPAPIGAIDVRAFGAKGDGRSDDSDALQAAFDGLEPGQWLVFPPGTYLHSRSLYIRRPGIVIDGSGATLHATNPDDQALQIQADNVRLQGFTMTAVTRSRLDAAWQSRIAVWRGVAQPPVVGVAIVGNRIVESGEPGSARANSASAAGIFVHNAREFLVAGNTVRRSLADGIQVTGGSRAGQVVANTVQETGDDTISVVSYLNESLDPLPPTAAAATLPALREGNLARDIVIASNQLAAPYWGRGIAVVGGEDITIVDNSVDASTHAAAVYIAREHNFGSFGVRNVVVRGNRLTRVQTTDPPYRPAPEVSLSSGPRTGHGAIELVAMQYADEAAHPALRDALVVRDVRVQGNLIDKSATPALRTGYGYAQQWSDGGVDGAKPRDFSGAVVRDIAFDSNTMTSVADGIEAFAGADPAFVISCSGNTRDGLAYASSVCRSTSVAVTGAAQRACVWLR